MEFLSVSPSSLLPIQNHPKTHIPLSKTAFPPLYPLQNRFSSPQTIFQSTNLHQKRLSFLQTNHLLSNSFKTHQTISCLFSSEQCQFSTLQYHLSILKSASFLKIPSTQLPNPLQNHIPILKRDSFLRIPTNHLPIAIEKYLSVFKTASFIITPGTLLTNPIQDHLSIDKTNCFLKIPIHLPHPLQTHVSNFKIASFLMLMAETVPFPSFAAEIAVPTEQVSDKINIESILISIDDFFNRYPFFVASVTFVWLVVIPLIQDYLKKFKYVPAIDAFRKLKNDPNTQLLDVRDKKSLLYLRSPNLKILNKTSVQVEFLEGDEERFVKEVLMNFGDPANTVICVLDNFDGNSLKVAELLFKSGFKEAYAIKGGLRGKNGWQEIQENLLPPSMHVYPRKNGKQKTSQKLDVNNERIDEKSGDNMVASTSILLDGKKTSENGYVKPKGTAPRANLGSEKPLSPYPNYPDMKPPSSPTPSKPN